MVKLARWPWGTILSRHGTEIPLPSRLSPLRLVGMKRSLKENERKLAASRIWQKLTGAAKSVVRHLDPGDFDDSNGLTKLLNVLRESPLQKLPVPDSFSRLEKWSQLRRGPQETIPQLIVREEDLFVELQQALKRARAERAPSTRTATTSTSRSERPPSQSPSASPTAAPGAKADDGEEIPVYVEPAPSTTTGFFEDELRGYRLLKASKLSMTERQTRADIDEECHPL